ncbi:MAG: amidohydrolase [Brevinematales bacterium]|nr:amidohydrolase [Brevinematales bacterium]
MADFYDVHTHFFNLSHPNFFSFIERLNLAEYLFIMNLPVIGPIISTFFYASRKKKLINALSFMDRDINDALDILEKKDIFPLFQEGFKIESLSYDRFILIPLIIDFGQKYTAHHDEIWYNINPHKAVKYQVIDLFEGIKEFYKENDKKILIFPFLGINPKNYSLENEYDENGHIKTIGIKSLLDKHFKYFSKENLKKRKESLIKKMGKFKDIESLGNYAFCGIKLYPPLGFDPMPEKEKEREKVEYLYEYCSKKAIPITTHIGVGGFQTIDNKKCNIFASPEKWKTVLKKFPDLKLNLAHLKQKDFNFTKGIIELIIENKNVYSDLAYSGFNKKEYQEIEKKIKKITTFDLQKIYERILFGSDFSISLLRIDSYSSILKNFATSDAFFNQKHLIVNENPERFLFG